MGSRRRSAKLQAEHVRLSLNAIAVKSDRRGVTDDQNLLKIYVSKATDAAINIIDHHQEAANTDSSLGFGFEVNILLAQIRQLLI